jgi:hypothetical protein
LRNYTDSFFIGNVKPLEPASVWKHVVILIITHWLARHPLLHSLESEVHFTILSSEGDIPAPAPPHETLTWAVWEGLVFPDAFFRIRLPEN